MKETTKQRNARINAENKNFMKMSRPRRRVAIARDVLAQLDAKTIAAKARQYLSSYAFRGLENTQPNSQLQEHLQAAPTCQACALGSMFVCGVLRVNAITVKQSIKDGILKIRPHGYLQRFFSRNQLKLIETTFEQTAFFANGLSELRKEQALSFVSEVAEADGRYNDQGGTNMRLRLIMENIIANKGTFKPEIKPRNQVVTPGYRG